MSGSEEKMFTVKKILTSLILPPGIFVVLALLSGLWMLRRRNKFGILNLILAALIYFLSISPVADSLTSPLEKDWQIPRKIDGDVIVVLGGGIYSWVQDSSGWGFPTGASLSRLATAVRLHRAIDAPIIYSGGAVHAGNMTEAWVAKRILMDLGVAAARIIVEDQSRDTAENVRFVKKILQKGNWRQPILVTSAFHMTRALIAFQKAGMEVTPYPADFRVAAHRVYGWQNFLPSPPSLARSAQVIKEYLGILSYKLKLAY
jgi:uncharacterized SAM-binding protein YcdF (DUF218 family)